ncbi:MAG: DUF421 domain-containing protein [Gemmatimonadaceae bacterium]
MSFIVRCALIYVFLLLVFRIAGKRALADITTFDIVLLLIISEATQQALTVDDASLTTAMLLIGTFITMEIALTFLALRWRGLDRWLNSLPVAIVQDGRVLDARMRRLRINLDEVRAAARTLHGIADLEQVEHAVLETNGDISIIPRGKKTATA